MNAVLEARGLAKSFGGRCVFSDVSVTVAAGEFVAVLGPSGSGKTTLFRCLTRLVEPDQGSVTVAGLALTGVRGRSLQLARRNIGVVFQQFNLVRRLSALENVLAARLADAPMWRVMTRSFDTEDEARAIAALEAVGLSDRLDQRADTLSGGQQQRVAIARALAQGSRVILADEPVASLDPETTDAVLSLLRSIARESGLAVVCSLHQPRLADRYADRVLRMQDGRLSAR